MSEHDNRKPEHPVSQIQQLDGTTLPKSQLSTDEKTTKPQSKWNTKNLFSRLASDVASAAAAASLVAPIISIIDRYRTSSHSHNLQELHKS